jgi:sec-independent protein translocase protein TatB
MPNFTLSEILTIALVILIVFGPQRLPEMSRKAGQLIRKARLMLTDLRSEFEGEIREVAEPLREVGDELKGIRSDMSGTLNSLTAEVREAKRDVERRLGAPGSDESNSETAGEPGAESNEAEGSDEAESSSEAESSNEGEKPGQPGDGPAA